MHFDDQASNSSQVTTSSTTSSTTSRCGRKTQDWRTLKSFTSFDEYTNFIKTEIPYNVSRTSHGTIKCKHDNSHKTRTELRICKGHFVEENGSTNVLLPCESLRVESASYAINMIATITSTSYKESVIVYELK